MAIAFVPFDEMFLEASWKWLQDDELRTLIDAPQITREQQKEWYDRLPFRKNYFIWGVLENNIPIGACGLKNVHDGKGEYWGYIGDKAYWARGIGKLMVDFIEEYAKRKSLKEIELQVIEINKRAIQLYSGKGFEKTGSLNNLCLMKKRLKND